MIRQAVLLVGSPRWIRSTSYSLGSYLLAHLNEFETEIIHIHQALREQEKTDAMINSIEKAELVIISSPLYVDSLPAVVIRTLELVGEHRKSSPREKGQRFVAILNCGFPEVQHNDTAMSILRHFAVQTGFQWAGGLAMGMGPAINGAPLTKVGGVGRYARKALLMAAAELTAGGTISRETIETMAKRPMPIWFYNFMANRTWKKLAKRYGMENQLKNRPYE